MGATRFGLLLRRLRERAGLTQEELAERAGLSANAISALERGIRQHPYPHTLRVLARALDLDDGDRAALEASVSPRARHQTLPAPLTPLVDREKELQDVVEILASGGTRLLTLTGTGGVGKTRLALAAAEGLASGFDDGAVLVSLAPLRAPELVLATIAHALDIRRPGDGPLREVLQGYLRDREALLVLDNFEHLLSAAPDISALLAQARRLRVLVTSRSPLHIQGEQLYPVLPLPIEWAVSLFEARSAQLAPSADRADRGAIREICRRLDRLPLAIELAAARTRVLLPEELLARLDQALTILAGGPRDVPERLQALRMTIAWSHDLLSPPEKILFRRLSVFSGGWTLGGAAAVGQVDDAVALEIQSRLLDASLVERHVDGGQVRFTMLETIRAYAAQELETSGEIEEMRDRHAGHYRALALQAGVELWGPSQAVWLDRLESEYENLRVALRRLLHHDRFEEAAGMCFALWLFLWVRGHIREGQAWADEAVARGTSLSRSGRSRLLFTSATMLFVRGRHEDAGARFDEAARLVRGDADPRTLPWTLAIRSLVAIYEGRPEVALRTLDEADALGRSLAQLDAAVFARALRGFVLIDAGRLAEAASLIEACENEARAGCAPWTQAAITTLQLRFAVRLGEYVRAQEVARRSIGLLARLRDTWMMMNALLHLATADARTSNPRRAARLYGAVDALIERCGSAMTSINQELIERSRRAVAAQLGQREYEILLDEGAGLSPDAIVALATSPGTDH